jgi:protein-disulfide isomerase
MTSVNAPDAPVDSLAGKGDRLRRVPNTKRLCQLTRAAVTAVALMTAVIAGLMASPNPTARAADARAIRVTSGNLITDPDGQPTVVLSLYEDSLCPYCRKFEHTFGATVDKLIATGAIAADYYMVAILDRPNRDYSSRAGAAAYCVADQSIDAFRRFKTALYTHQPAESATSFPDNAALIDMARRAGAGDATADCINDDTYTGTVAGMADATNVEHTPTVRINGQDYELSTPEALVASIEQLVPPVASLAPVVHPTVASLAPGAPVPGIDAAQ